MSEAHFTAGQALTGMCLWEAWTDLIGSLRQKTGLIDDTPADKALRIQERIGAWACRDLMASCIKHCDEAWVLADALEDGGYNGSFDWDFVPDWLVGAIESGRFD